MSPADRVPDRASPPEASPTAADWMRRLRPHRRSDGRRAVYELAITLGPFLLGWGFMAWALANGLYALYLVLLLPTAGFLVRLFMIQHDCGHGSFLPGRRANDWTGRLLGVLTQTPYDDWRRSHAIHHAGVGNLDARGIGDIDTLSLREYDERTRWGRLRYRIYRHPIVMFGIGPAFVFLIQHRFPRSFARGGARSWTSAMGTNLGIAALAAAGMAVVGPWVFLLVHLPVALVAATIGVWLFYVQHQFEKTYWASDVDWNVADAALHGSSHLDLPAPLRWFSANIGLHHVHHLSSGIPFYRLPDVLRDYPELREVNRLTLGHSLRCLRLVLWDEAEQRLISFAERRRKREAAPGELRLEPSAAE